MSTELSFQRRTPQQTPADDKKSRPEIRPRRQGERGQLYSTASRHRVVPPQPSGKRILGKVLAIILQSLDSYASVGARAGLAPYNHNQRYVHAPSTFVSTPPMRISSFFSALEDPRGPSLSADMLFGAVMPAPDRIGTPDPSYLLSQRLPKLVIPTNRTCHWPSQNLECQKWTCSIRSRSLLSTVLASNPSLVTSQLQHRYYPNKFTSSAD